MNIEILLGKTIEHLVSLEGTKFFVHQQMLHDFLKLQKDARSAGYELTVISAFRDYERQLFIWNAKARGERPLFDDKGQELQYDKLSPREIMYAILRWSALPGCSRHHWGSDVDVFDLNTQKPQDVKLVPEECTGHGPASGLHDWLDTVMATKSSYGFYRPYNSERGGVAPERWHLSYFPIARRIEGEFTYSIFKKNLEGSEILLKEELLAHSFEIFERFFKNTDLP